jgi:hypothetical protein
MRLSDWRASAKPREALGPKVTEVLQSALSTLGAEDDPHAWIVWGEDPAMRYMVFVPTPPGLIVAAVRVNVPQEGPRVSAKLVRWSKLQPTELTVEARAGHRMLSFQLEQQVLKGIDGAADAIARFILVVLAAIDGRPWPAFDPPGRGAARGRPAGAAARRVAERVPAATPTRSRAARP